MVTTIKVSDETRDELERMKEGRESFDDVVARLIGRFNRKDLREELIEGYSSMTAEQFAEFKEWDRLP